MKDWGKFFGVREEFIIPYIFHQNGIVEYNIQITENNIRVIYKDSEMGMIFWDKVVKMDIHICNYTAVGPEINNSKIIPYED